MGYALLLTLAGMLQGVMVSLNGQLNGWFDPITVAFFVHSIPTVLLILYLKVYRHAKIFAKASVRLMCSPWDLWDFPLCPSAPT